MLAGQILKGQASFQRITFSLHRSAARRMASILGESVGQTVGYKVRLDSKVSAATQIEVVTEGEILVLVLKSFAAKCGLRELWVSCCVFISVRYSNCLTAFTPDNLHRCAAQAPAVRP